MSGDDKDNCAAVKRKHKRSVQHIQKPQVSKGGLGLSLLQIHKNTLTAKRRLSGDTHAVSVAVARTEISNTKIAGKAEKRES